jgi:hypothetical protein
MTNNIEFLKGWGDGHTKEHLMPRNDASVIREDIYKALYRIRNKLCNPRAIYLGRRWLRALDELARVETGVYGERIKTFCDVPIYEVVGQPNHFFVAIEEPER